MKFQPKTEDEAMADQMCLPGKAPFTVLAAAEKISKSGKEMIALKLNVHADDGFNWHIYDYISPEFMAHKFRHFFFSVGLGAQYEAGEIHADILPGREGWCEVDIQKAKGEFKPKNIIKDYQVGTTATNPAPLPTTKIPEPVEDDVPF